LVKPWAWHFITLCVPEQVNAMIERFLVISLPAWREPAGPGQR
jgi:hypothetical protein